MTDHLLLFARDPGATNQIVALLRLMTGDTPDSLRKTASQLSSTLPLPPKTPTITTVAKDYACGRLMKENLPFIAWEEFFGPPVQKHDPVAPLRDKLHAEGITHIATGVSDNDDKSHHNLWQAARLGDIPCVTLLDDNTNLAARFTGESGQIAWPDRVYAVSERSRAPLQSMGIPDTAIETITNLHLFWLLEHNSSENLKEARALRKIWGADDNDQIILFASQPIQEMRAFQKPANFDELACLAQLSRRLNQDDFPSVVVIRPHPRDVPGKYTHLVGEGPPRTIISDEGAPASAILAADRVAGMTSMMLEEAIALSRPIIRLTSKHSDR